jgi:hypothetical protein
LHSISRDAGQHIAVTASLNGWDELLNRQNLEERFTERARKAYQLAAACICICVEEGKSGQDSFLEKSPAFFSARRIGK